MRELRNLLERTALLCDGDLIEPDHVRQAIATGRRAAARPADAHVAVPALAPGATGLKALERDALRNTVARHTGSRAELAQHLGISERSLYRKLKALGLATGDSNGST